VNRWIDEITRTGALVVTTGVLVAGAMNGTRPWVLGFRLVAVFFGVWGAGYLVAYVVSRILLTEAVRREEARLASTQAEIESEAAKRRSRAA
jgi:hypothetical protein